MTHSYAYYNKILETIKEGYDIRFISDLENILKTSQKKPVCFIRHDIDVSVYKAFEMAVIENIQDVSSTYYVRVNTDFYHLDRPVTQAMLKEMVRLGHEIGFHYDIKRDADIMTCCGIIEKITGTPVRTISFHRPASSPNLLNLSGIRYSGLINSYSKPLMNFYIADSKGVWAGGDPLARIQKPEGKVLQFLAHPIWWSEQEQIPDRYRDELLQKFKDGW